MQNEKEPAPAQEKRPPLKLFLAFSGAVTALGIAVTASGDRGLISAIRPRSEQRVNNPQNTQIQVLRTRLEENLQELNSVLVGQFGPAKGKEKLLQMTENALSGLAADPKSIAK